MRRTAAAAWGRRLACVRTFSYEPANIFLTIKQGRPNGMPAWGEMLLRSVIWDLAAYVQNLSAGPERSWGTTVSANSPKVQQISAGVVVTDKPWSQTQPLKKGRKNREARRRAFHFPRPRLGDGSPSAGPHEFSRRPRRARGPGNAFDLGRDAHFNRGDHRHLRHATCSASPPALASSVRDLVSPRPKDLGLVYWGVGVTTATLFAVTVWTMLSLSALSRTPENLSPVTLEVIGHQWWWELRYHDGDPAQDFATANEIHIPVGQAVRVVLRSADVIHSFWIPQLAGKTDLIPGQINETWLHADREGVYRGQCGEFCGKQHAHMALLVIAEPQEGSTVGATGSSKKHAGGNRPRSKARRAGLRCKNAERVMPVRGTTANGVYGPTL